MQQSDISQAYRQLKACINGLHVHYCYIDTTNERVLWAKEQIQRLYDTNNPRSIALVDALRCDLSEWPECDDYLRDNLPLVLADLEFWTAIAKYPVQRRDPKQRLKNDEKHAALVDNLRDAWREVKQHLFAEESCKDATNIV